MPQLVADCLNEIFEYLDDDYDDYDNFTLHSCMLVNRLWCEVSVRILWRDTSNYSTSNIKTLIGCLPNESRDILQNNEINISPSTSKLPIFNYASFCEVLSVNEIHDKLEKLLEQSITIVEQEILKLFMNQIPSLKRLEIIEFDTLELWKNTSIISYPEIKDCLKNLTELCCNSDNSSEFICQLSNVCHSILHLELIVYSYISDELANLISAQKSLEYIDIRIEVDYPDLSNLLSIELPNTLTKLTLYEETRIFEISLLFITKFINLKELEISFRYSKSFKDFEILQHTYFPQLQILELEHAIPKLKLLIKFLEISGKNLKKIYLGEYEGYYNNTSNNSLNLAIAEFCPNLRKLSTVIRKKELKSFKKILDNCQHLESITIRCGDSYLNEKESLEAVVKYSKSIHKIELNYHYDDIKLGILPEELESFFVSWSNCISRKSLSLKIITSDVVNSLDANEDNMKIIDKYIKLGVIKKFKVII
ncbi:hypothetical protein RclHR1_15440003 [Rhizophagus clarus]|uniref:F-box domain-containing protein n=1 Tax=Rhizophagus clarus TaxID=94130 RepID=A0A2Z6QJD0_9GLOM|nr:hypothetical protein RclHR1_15440003 [Rhizophagus clarus]GES91057.1 hypothetical protein GLOIN_2v1876445 [Rhizophagus clarus]